MSNKSGGIHKLKQNAKNSGLVLSERELRDLAYRNKKRKKRSRPDLDW